MKMLTLNRWGKDHQMTFDLDNYLRNGNLYVGLISHDEGYPEPWSDLTVNLGTKCEANRAFIDVNNNGMDIMNWLVDNKLGRITAREKVSGFCVYPEFEFDMDVLMQYVEGR